MKRRHLLIPLAGVLMETTNMAFALPPWAQIAATIGALLSGSYVVWLVVNGALRQWVFNPIRVSYVIPKRDYRLVRFEGASYIETYPSILTVGVGFYRIMHAIRPKSDIDLGPIVLRFKGPERNKPMPLGSDNPHIVDDVTRYSSNWNNPSYEFRNWDGEVYPSHRNWPIHLMKGERWYIGNRVQTFGPWRGEIMLTFPVHGLRLISTTLPFAVDQRNDDTPFLKGERVNGKTKERLAREAADEKRV